VTTNELQALDLVVSVLALAAAGAAGWAAFKTLWASYTPFVRPVPIPNPAAPSPTEIVLKNIGRGPALAVVVAEDPARDERTLVAEVDVIEPLGQPYGPGFVEKSRIGRVQLPTKHSQLTIGRSYRILYQDVAGEWHETKFTVSIDGFRTKFRGRQGPWDVPDWVRQRAQVVADAELL